MLIQIDPARIDDAHAIAEIHVLAWQSAYRDILPADYLASLSIAQREVMWSNAIQSGVPELLVAKVDGKIVGWIAFSLSRDEAASPKDAEIRAIYVAPSYWSCGVGRTLWRCALEQLLAQDYTSVSLWVLVENHRAIRFYLAAGCIADLATSKYFELGSLRLKEVRYMRRLGSL